MNDGICTIDAFNCEDDCSKCSYYEENKPSKENDMKIKDKVVFFNHRTGNDEVGEIQIIAKIEECYINGIVGNYVYYVNSSTGGDTLFRQNFKKVEK